MIHAPSLRSSLSRRSSHSPFNMTLTRRIRQLARLSPQEWADLAVAVMELALAQYRLAVRQETLIVQPTWDAARNKRAITRREARLIERVAWAVPRAAKVVPWRSDCLRQAEAGGRWLARRGIAAQIQFGVRKDVNGKPEMHAWLIAGTRVVTGGDIGSYTRFSARADTP